MKGQKEADDFWGNVSFKERDIFEYILNNITEYGVSTKYVDSNGNGYIIQKFEKDIVKGEEK